jgi:hypothetical protein
MSRSLGAAAMCVTLLAAGGTSGDSGLRGRTAVAPSAGGADREYLARYGMTRAELLRRELTMPRIEVSRLIWSPPEQPTDE